MTEQKRKRVRVGLEREEADAWGRLKGMRLGLLVNQASVTGDLAPAPDVIARRFPGRLKALFSPQHGHGGQDQDNMVETAHSVDRRLGIPIFSLYADTREPPPEALEMIDALIIDLQDVGTRVYTFASTVLNCLRAAAEKGVRVLVLDRPNPLGGEILEGNLLSPEMYSFVGPCRFPMRHGLTMGEMARIFDAVFHLGSDLEIVPMEGWRRRMQWPETGLRWIPPSPNMPSFATARVYPGQVIWEGTLVSEGRGTCRPFEIFGAPYMETDLLRRQLDPEALKGCLLQDFVFRPTFHKWHGRLCRGFMIHVLDPVAYRPYHTALSLLQAVMTIHSGDFRWKMPPYEYEYERRPIDLILGDPSLRRDLEAGIPVSALAKGWEADLASFDRWRQPFLLYR